MNGRLLRGRLVESNNIWPGFVDVLATLLIVIIFILMVFTVSQIYLSDAISGRDKALENLRNQIKSTKVGHAGSLDPFAQGILMLCTGNKTKIIESFMDQKKKPKRAHGRSKKPLKRIKKQTLIPF